MTEPERQTMEADIVCVGFGPATGGFLTALAKRMTNPDGTPALPSRVAPGMPPQILVYERADDVGAGVSGVVTRARGIRAHLADEDLKQIPLATPVRRETTLYLLDPIGASRRSPLLRMADSIFRATRAINPWWDADSVALPVDPPFMSKHGGWLLSIGQFNQWVASQVMATGAAQIWPGMPAAEPLLEGGRVAGVRLADQGVDKDGKPGANYMPGIDVRADLTVVADGPVGRIGRALDERLGLPANRHQREWAVGMKFVVNLPDGCALKPGDVLHTFGFPEPEIFGFLYVYEGKIASLGIFVPSSYGSPVRTAYRYLQHWMMHPRLWRHLERGTLRSWGAKSLQESGLSGEPRLVGDGFARIGEGSGSTNMLTGSGVDEAWTTGAQLAEAVAELLKAGTPFTREALEATYVKRRRASWVERGASAARRARDGFRRGFISGMLGMGLAGLTGGRLFIPARSKRLGDQVDTLESWFGGRIPAAELARMRSDAAAKGQPLRDALMERLGWPAIPLDGKLLVSHQDALLLGGKVQAPAGWADHVTFVDRTVCVRCDRRVCYELCSAQAITPGEGGLPVFDREKCVHCGACLWNCSQPRPGNPELGIMEFRAGAGGLHSVEN
ncbi:MAG: 4Fe-4S ferredoxin [Candidatus Coatesbacteria bacterium]